MARDALMGNFGVCVCVRVYCVHLFRNDTLTMLPESMSLLPTLRWESIWLVDEFLPTHVSVTSSLYHPLYARR